MTALWSMTNTAVLFNIVPLFRSRGLPEQHVALLYTGFAISLAIMQLVGGIMADRYPLHRLLCAAATVYNDSRPWPTRPPMPVAIASSLSVPARFHMNRVASLIVFLLFVFALIVFPHAHAQGQEQAREPAAAAVTTAPAAKPNVLFIAIDDLRPQLRAYGHEFMVTPHMDKLAAQGRLFERHYVQVPTCGASRYALLSGQWPQRPASRGNGAFVLHRQGHAPKSLPQWLREHGYQTVQMGKISHSPDGLERDGKPEVPEAWDVLSTPAGEWKTPWNAFFGYEGGRTRQVGKSPPMEAAAVNDAGYPDGLMAAAAVEQLAKLREGGKPFFFALGFFKPHLPFCAPKKYWDLYDRDKIDISDVDPVRRTGGEFFGNYGHDAAMAKDDAYVRELRHGYYASTSYVDAQIGTVLAALDDLKLSDNTIVILWGDHGYHLGELGYWGKHTLHEHSLRSAFIVRTPGMKQPGKATRALIQSVDIYPSIVELAKLPVPDHLDGHSFAAALSDPAAPLTRPALGFWPGGETIRSDHHRLIRQGGKITLYDHRTDAGERKDLAKDEPELVEKLTAELEAMLKGRKAK